MCGSLNSDLMQLHGKGMTDYLDLAGKQGEGFLGSKIFQSDINANQLTPYCISIGKHRQIVQKDFPAVS